MQLFTPAPYGVPRDEASRKWSHLILLIFHIDRPIYLDMFFQHGFRSRDFVKFWRLLLGLSHGGVFLERRLML